MQQTYITKPAATLTVVLLLLTSCMTTQPVEDEQAVDPLQLVLANHIPFGPRPDIPAPEDIHQLSPQQIQDFLGYMQSPANAHLEKPDRLAKYLRKLIDGFEYGSITYDASGTLAHNSGNCMSLSVLTTALAKLVDLDVKYQLIDDSPVYENGDDTVVKGLHIRTLLFDPLIDVDLEGLIMGRPGIRIDFFLKNRQRFISNLDESEYLAMYFENLAAEALSDGLINKAYWFALEALKLEPDHSSAINKMAVIQRRSGQTATAEALYRYGITHAEDKLTLMKNYLRLLEDSGRETDAQAIRQQLDRMDDPSPYHWYQLARSTHDNGEYREAIRYYNKALSIAPYLHEAYLGIALSHYALGQLENSRQALVLAYTEAPKPSMRNLYQAKLTWLSREMADL